MRKPEAMAGRDPGDRKAGGGSVVVVLNPSHPTLTAFAGSLPQEIVQGDINRLFGGLKHSKEELVQILQVLLRGLLSQKPATQKDFYTALALLIKFNKELEPQLLLDTVGQLLTTTGENTKGERTGVYAARILALGALVRGKGVNELESEVLQNVLDQLVLLAQKKLSLLKIGSPFICEMLRSITPEQRKELDFQGLSSLVAADSKSSSILQISIVAHLHDVNLETDILETMEGICKIIVLDVKHDDRECIDLLFSYVSSANLGKEFWETFMEKLGPYHFDLLLACIKKSLEKGCSLKYLIRPEVIQPLLKVLRSEDTDVRDKAVSCFRLLLNWNEKSCTMNRKERKAGLKVLFEEDPSLLSEYKILHAILRQFLTSLTVEELDVVAAASKTLAEAQKYNRLSNSAITFLARITQLKTTSDDTKIDIAKYLFVEGFCISEKGDTLETDEDSKETDGNHMRKRLCREAFESVVKSTYNKTLFDGIFDHASQIVSGEVQDVVLEQNLAMDLPLFEKTSKLARSIQDEDVSNLLKAYGVFLCVDSKFASIGVELLLELFGKKKVLPRSEVVHRLVKFILSAICEDRIIFNYEALYTRFLIEGILVEDSVQELINVIEVQIEETEAPSDDDEDDDDSSVDEDAKQVNGIELSEKYLIPDTEPENIEDDLDMDEATEAELELMDQTLSNVFSAQKKVKNERKLRSTFTLRVLHMVEMLLRRYKVPEATIPLMLLIPCLSLLTKVAKRRNTELLSRTTSVLRKLNEIRKVTGGEAIDAELVDQVVLDVNSTLNRKWPKTVRKLILDSARMINRCFVQKSGVDVPSATHKGNRKRKASALK